MIGSVLKVLVSSFGIQFFGLVSGILLARQLGPDLRGQLALLVAWPQVLGVISSAGLDVVAGFQVAKSPKNILNIYISSIVSCFVIGIPFFVIYLFWGGTLSSSSIHLTFATHLVSAAMIFAAGGSAVSLGTLLGMRQFGNFALVRAFYPGCILIIAFFVFFLNIDSMLTILLLYLISNILTYFLSFHILVRRSQGGEPFSKNNLIRNIFRRLKESKGFALQTSLTTLNQNFAILVAGALMKGEAVGHFAVAQVVAMLHVVFAQALSKVEFSRIAQYTERTLSEREAQELRASVQLLIVFYAVSVSAGWFVLPIIVRLVYGSAFAEAANLSALLVPATAIGALGLMPLEALRAKGYSWPGNVSFVLSMACFLLVVVFSQQNIQITDVAQAYSVAAVVRTSLLFLFTHLLLKLKLNALLEFRIEDAAHLLRELKSQLGRRRA